MEEKANSGLDRGLDLLEKYGIPLISNPNKKLLPIHVLDVTEEGASAFNEVYRWLLNSSWNLICRTPSGGISISRRNFKPPMWDVSYTSSCVELTILGKKMLRIQFRQKTRVDTDTGETPIYGRQAFEYFRTCLAAEGVDIDKYAIDAEQAKIEKQKIPRYIIKLANPTFADMVFTCCHHIDFHNSFPAGLANHYPEFRPTIEKLYAGRKTNPKNKAVLNLSVGYMQSEKCCGARWAHLSRVAIEDNNRRVEEMAKRLTEAGRLVISYNTDGIWYCGEAYHGPGEGKGLGQWENDHIDCTLRHKSAGAYEYMEDGKYFPVVRGRTNLDRIKDRSEWQWGDIYTKEASPIAFAWVPGKGIEIAR